MKHPASLRFHAANTPASVAAILVRGIGLELRAPLHAAAITKAGRLLRHHRRIQRIRIDFAWEHANPSAPVACASGRIELSGPDIVARVSSSNLSESLDLLIDRLARMLRERTKRRVNRRNDRPVGMEFRDLLAPSLPA